MSLSACNLTHETSNECLLRRLGVPSRNILGIDIAALNRQQALELLVHRILSHQKTAVAFMNANLMNCCLADPSLTERVQEMLVLNDGIGIDLASVCFYLERFPSNLNGTDFLPELLGALPRGTRVFLYGGRREIVSKAARALQMRFPITLAGFVDGFEGDAERVLATIKAAHPDLLLVALGNPLQERWLAEHCGHLDGTLAIGVGAYFDHVAGAVIRAPRWMRRLGLEWVWRLANEPKRLGKRYTLGVSAFLATVLVKLISGKIVALGARARS